MRETPFQGKDHFNGIVFLGPDQREAGAGQCGIRGGGHWLNWAELLEDAESRVGSVLMRLSDDDTWLSALGGRRFCGPWGNSRESIRNASVPECWVLRRLRVREEGPWERAGGRLGPGSPGVRALSGVAAPSLPHLPVPLRDGIFASGEEALHVHPAEDRAN